MGGSSYQKFFTRPKEFVHRRYECLRAVFVEGMAMKKAAERFKVAYGTVRNWAHEFRAVHDQGGSPPFLFTQNGGAPSTSSRQNSPRKIRP
jgi:transposase